MWGEPKNSCRMPHNRKVQCRGVRKIEMACPSSQQCRLAWERLLNKWIGSADAEFSRDIKRALDANMEPLKKLLLQPNFSSTTSADDLQDLRKAISMFQCKDSEDAASTSQEDFR